MTTRFFASCERGEASHAARATVFVALFMCPASRVRLSCAGWRRSLRHKSLSRHKQLPSREAGPFHLFHGALAPALSRRLLVRTATEGCGADEVRSPMRAES